MLAHLLRALQNCTVRATMPALLELLLEQMSGADEQHDRKIAAVQALLCVFLQDGIRWICVLHIYVNFHKGPHWADI